jgi:hypothetical protein
MNTEAQNKFKKDGFLLTKGAVDLKLIDAFLSDWNLCTVNQLKFLNKEISTTDNLIVDLFKNLQTLLNADVQRYLASLKTSVKIMSLQNCFLTPFLLDGLKSLGIEGLMNHTSPVLHVMSKELKIPNGYMGLGVHQDWPSMQSSLNSINLWMPFVKVDESNFTLEVIPETHKRGLVKGVTKEHILEVSPEEYKEDDFVSIVAEPGDILFMSNFLIHRSSQKGDDERVRLAASWRFEDYCETTFINRGYPMAQGRHVNRDLITPDFPKQEDIAKFFGD